MKKILSFCFLSFLTVIGFAQTFQATIQPLDASGNGVIVFVNTSAFPGITGKVSSLTITIAIPTSVGARPPISIDNTADPYITYDVYNAINQVVDGESHYIYNILGTGDVTQPGATMTWSSGSDVPMATIRFNGTNAAISSQIKMVSLPDGGSDPNPNSFFGFSVDGIDRVDEFAMFYGLPLISEAVNDGQGYFGTSFARTIPLVPLPVKFTSFNVVKKDNDGLLTWSIENESSMADHYEVERSLNAVDFTVINTTARKLNGASSNAYNYTDANLTAVRKTGLIYYRIKQVDKDGKFVYTDIKSVKVGSNGFNVSVYPNPVVSNSEVDINLNEAGRINIQLFDATGKLISASVLEGVKGLNTHPLNMSKLSSGTYMVRIIAGEQVQTIPVIKK
ncbi:MAG: T9SS type A sorting domain-containing protein [Bacteroidetes bacterium]|nr:T9SS type A sorting domain-containing protein [Bacteroidota bacterium]